MPQLRNIVVTDHTVARVCVFPPRPREGRVGAILWDVTAENP